MDHTVAAESSKLQINVEDWQSQKDSACCVHSDSLLTVVWAEVVDSTPFSVSVCACFDEFCSEHDFLSSCCASIVFER